MTQYGTLRIVGVHRHVRWSLRDDRRGESERSSGRSRSRASGRRSGVLLIGLPVSIFIATLPIALAQAMRAIADVGDTVAAR